MEHPPALRAEIVSLLLENLNLEVPSVHEDLIETGLLDSLKIVELLVELEQRFRMKIELADVEIDHFRSVASMANFVAHYDGSKGMSSAASVPVGPDSRLPVPDEI